MWSETQGYKHPLYDAKEKVAAGSVADVLTFGPVRTGRLWVLSKVVVYDGNNAPTSARAYIKGGGVQVDVGAIASFVAAEAGVMDGPIYVPEGRELEVYVVGATSNDGLRVSINGYEVDQLPEGVGYEAK